MRMAAVGAGVGVVLADSSVVILALPAVLSQFHATITSVAWVLVAFNLVMALLAVPAAYASRWFTSGRVLAGGLVVLAAASAVAAAAGSLDVLLAARCVQAVGGAAAVCAGLDVLPALAGSESRAAAIWVTCGALGAAVGPAVGGILTELVSWRAIFLIQVPIALGVAAAAPRGQRAVGPRAGRPHLGANLALGLVSAALTAALFLVVLLLIDGYRYTPVAAAVVVTVMPLAAVPAGRLGRRVRSTRIRAASGALLIAGGLASLGLLPAAGWHWIVVPEVMIGAGLALTLSALTEAALSGRSRQGIHGGWTVAARHAGVVLGLLILTPLFTADLQTQQQRAEESATSILIAAPLSITTKLHLANQLERRLVGGSATRVPDLAPVFHGSTGALAQVGQEILDQVARAVTAAFRRSFLLAGLLALLALLPIGLGRLDL